MRQLGHNTSVYLDAMRFAAALVVFFTHAHHFLLPDLDLGPLTWGREAVTVFFVLSGFVISYVAGTKEARPGDYATARSARIFPVAALAIVVTILCDALGNAVNPAYYVDINAKFNGFYVPATLPAIASYLTFTNQLWCAHVVVGSDEPFWSLGFEVQYYLFFFLVTYLEGRRRVALTLAWAVLVGPKILLYLPIWLMGVLAQRIVLRQRAPNVRLGALLSLLSLALFLATKSVLGDFAANMYKTYPLDREILNFVYFSLIGLSVAILIVGASLALDALPPLRPAATRVVRWLAGGSFTLYLVHQPLLLLASALIEPVERRVALAVVATAAVLVVCYLLAECAERRKHVYSDMLRGKARAIA